MAKAAKNNKSIILENVEVFYQEKSDSLNIVSTDPDLPKGEFFMKVKEGTPTDIALRKLFSQKTGNTKPLGNDLSSDLPQETVTLTDVELSRGYDKYTFPIGVTKDREPVTFEINRTGYPTNILISGTPGCGKTIVTEQILRKAEISGIPVLKWDHITTLNLANIPTHLSIRDLTLLQREKFNAELEKFNAELEKLFSEHRDVAEPTIVIIDGLEHYLAFPWDSDNYYHVKNWQDQISEFVKLLRLSRSKNVVFVMSSQRPDHYLMEMIAPCLTLNIVGHLETVFSAIVLGTNDAVKLKNGQFIVKTGQETKGMKAYHPAMKSDWV
jgi:Cdc6-like AAA superfamily ATPase